MVFKRAGAFLALVFGLLGVVACMAGIYADWRLAARLDRANEQIFAALDKGLASAQDRVRGVQKRVQESKISAGEFGQHLRDWSVKKAQERLVTQLDIEGRAGKLAQRLQAVDSLLETSTESIRGIQQILVLGQSLGATLDPASLEQMLEILASARGTMQQAEQTVDGIRAFAAGTKEESEESRLARVAKLIGRVLLTIGEVDPRLEDVATRLSEMRTDVQQTKARMSNHILVAAVAGGLVLVWIAAGQVALCAFGWAKIGRRGAIGAANE